MLDHLDDLASDFSVFHRVDDIGALPGPAFFKLAWRISAYQGVMTFRAASAGATAAPADPSAAQTPRSSPATAGQRRVVPATKAALSMDPAFKGIFSFGKGR